MSGPREARSEPPASQGEHNPPPPHPTAPRQAGRLLREARLPNVPALLAQALVEGKLKMDSLLFKYMRDVTVNFFRASLEKHSYCNTVKLFCKAIITVAHSAKGAYNIMRGPAGAGTGFNTSTSAAAALTNLPFPSDRTIDKMVVPGCGTKMGMGFCSERVAELLALMAVMEGKAGAKPCHVVLDVVLAGDGTDCTADLGYTKDGKFTGDVGLAFILGPEYGFEVLEGKYVTMTEDLRGPEDRLQVVGGLEKFLLEGRGKVDARVVEAAQKLKEKTELYARREDADLENGALWSGAGDSDDDDVDGGGGGARRGSSARGAAGKGREGRGVGAALEGPLARGGGARRGSSARWAEGRGVGAALEVYNHVKYKYSIY
jgi:hypothetical protein